MTWQDLAKLEGAARTIRDALVKLDDVLAPSVNGGYSSGSSEELQSPSGYHLARVRWHRMIPPEIHVGGDRVSIADARALRDWLDGILRRAAPESSQQRNEHEPAGE